MSTVRIIKLKVLSQVELIKVETSARTLGELKSEVSGLGIDWSAVKLIDRSSKATFEMDDAVLPATDALMFVMPTKSKAGSDLPYSQVKSLIKQYKLDGGNVPFNYTQATTVQMNKFWNKVKSNGATPVAETPVSPEKPMESQENETITLKPGTYTIVVECDEVEVVDETTLDDLEDEAKELKNLLK